MDGITPVENDVASVMHMVKAIDVRDLIAVCDALTMCGSIHKVIWTITKGNEFMICYLKRHVVATPDVLGALQQ